MARKIRRKFDYSRKTQQNDSRSLGLIAAMLNIPQLLATELALQPAQIQNALELFAEGATVPFIARYRKERTDEMNEIQLRDLQDRHSYLTER